MSKGSVRITKWEFCKSVAFSSPRLFRQMHSGRRYYYRRFDQPPQHGRTPEEHREMELTIEVTELEAPEPGTYAGGTWRVLGDDAHCYRHVAQSYIESLAHNDEVPPSSRVELFTTEGHECHDNTTEGVWHAV